MVVRSVDGKLLLEGYVESQNDLERVNRIASLFSQDVVNLVEIKTPCKFYCKYKWWRLTAAR